MGYLFLIIATLSGTLKGYCGKKVSGVANDIKSSVLLNLIRMLFCILFGFLLVCATYGVDKTKITLSVIWVCALSGLSTAFFLVSWLISVRKSAYMMLDVFLMLGTLVPMLFSYLLFGEPVSLRQWIGFAALVVAALIMCSYNNSVKPLLTLSSFLLLVACGIASGVSGFCQKLFVKSFSSVPILVFNLYTYVFAAVALLVVFLLLPKKSGDGISAPAFKRSFVYILIMSAALISNTSFNTIAAKHLNSAKMYPLSQGLALILSTLMAAIFFGEKITKRAVFGILLSFVALMIMNL